MSQVLFNNLFIYFEEELMACSRVYLGGTIFGMPEVFYLFFVIYFIL